MIKKKEENQKRINKFPKVEIDFNPRIPPLKRTNDKTQVNVRYCLISPFAYAHIYWNKKNNELTYEIEEPQLTKEEEVWKEKIIYAMRNLIDYESIVEKDLEKLLDYIDKRLKIIAIELGINMNYNSFKKIYYYLCRDFIGFNKIDPLLKDFFVEDIECNGVEVPIYIVHRVYRNIKTNVLFEDEESLANFVEKLSQKSGKYISYANPILDGSLPDGSRVNATYTKDISSKGPTFTIRKFTKVPWTPTKLISFNTLSPEMLAYLWLLVQYKMSLLIAGGTASGKTTLLNAIAFFIPPELRVVSIEDTRELNLSRDNWLPSVVRGAIGTKESGEIDLFTLLRASFRQNPDYVIVGEVRGKEAFVLFQGMASGHPSISTLHADSVNTVVKRLQTPPIELSPTLMNVLDCVCVMTHALVKKQETRKLKEITEIINITDTGEAQTNTPYIWNPGEDTFYFKTNSRILEKISKRYGIKMQELEEEFRKRVQLIYNMYKQGIFGFKQVQDIIHGYYKNPQEVLSRFGINPSFQQAQPR